MSSCSASLMVLFLGAVESRGTLQPAQALPEEAAALEACDQTAPGVCLLDRKCAGVYARARDRVRHRRITGDHHVVGDADVACEPRSAADHAAPADGGAAGYSHAGGNRGVRADAHVVADHDEVVELHALLDHGVLDGAAIDGGVG